MGKANRERIARILSGEEKPISEIQHAITVPKDRELTCRVCHDKVLESKALDHTPDCWEISYTRVGEIPDMPPIQAYLNYIKKNIKTNDQLKQYLIERPELQDKLLVQRIEREEPPMLNAVDDLGI